jgi:nucleoside-diphosphate-sugar epimerase
MLKVLLSGESGHSYNISNPDSIVSIKEMAEILAQSGKVDLVMDLPTEDEKKGFNPMSNSSLESTNLEDLGWHGCFEAKIGFAHTVDILRDIIKAV